MGHVRLGTRRRMNKSSLIISRKGAKAQSKSLFFVLLRGSAPLREIFVFGFFHRISCQASGKGSSLRAGGRSFL